MYRSHVEVDPNGWSADAVRALMCGRRDEEALVDDRNGHRGAGSRRDGVLFGVQF
jgi:hypothetical protein